MPEWFLVQLEKCWEKENKMPQGNELHFGFSNSKDAFAFCKKAGIQIMGYDGTDDKFYPITLAQFIEEPEGIENLKIPHEIEVALENAYFKTLDELGWKWQKQPSKMWPKEFDILVNSPWGVRKVYAWTLHLQHDPDEMGDGPEDLSVSINLSARYYPCLTDMKSEHGAMPIKFNTETNRIIEIAKRHILEALPEMVDAELFIREIFY